MNELFALDPGAGYVTSTLYRLSEHAGFPMTLESLLEHWEAFVRQVEGGYQDSIYEYTNDLAVRELLKMIETDAPLSLRSKLTAYLEPLDQRFSLATHEAVHEIAGWSESRIALGALGFPNVLKVSCWMIFKPEDAAPDASMGYDP